ncbi:hypothetical protein N781_01755 [Pontibacillus halophilus JSM 076056 = DSM 19796]|uniref:YknX-like barrel-sandwich hybrid domain-containing protein n=1 Tax=Pontibacillus halophilus JSM 076056 = DSM 19796 TaxID=1385510 RepID=A0A0A5GS79_9BACI|nr:efflux RND transporter periplasmic adaptor subunit [Pontibacillus halophilus]KGX94093.1 hypothetical protein N781_01755 [Pontibacillus halophilus JSM 076056 = DSM 19796]
MKRKTKRKLLLLAFVLFIVTNGVLLWYEEGQLTQTSFVHQYDSIYTNDLYEKVYEEGVFESSKQEPLYFDDEVGSFQQFLVQEGDEVSEGTPIYEYIVRDYNVTRNRLETQSAKVEDEIDALQAYIDEVEDFQIPESDLNRSLEEEEDKESFVGEELQKETAIKDKQLQLAQKQAELEMLTNQLNQLEASGQVIEVSSIHEGTVTKISKSLEAPLMTVETNEWIVSGNLDEGNRKLVESGIPVRGTVETNQTKWEGSVDRVHTYPEKESEESVYPFIITLDDVDDRVLPGYHTTVEFVTAEALEATTAKSNWIHEQVVLEEGADHESGNDVVSDPQESAKREEQEEVSDDETREVDDYEATDSTEERLKEKLGEKVRYVWVMTSQGTIEATQVGTGLEVNGETQVVSGVSEGTFVADAGPKAYQTGQPFITPVQANEISWTNLKIQEPRTIWTSIKIGLLHR